MRHDSYFPEIKESIPQQPLAGNLLAHLNYDLPLAACTVWRFCCQLTSAENLTLQWQATVSFVAYAVIANHHMAWGNKLYCGFLWYFKLHAGKMLAA